MRGMFGLVSILLAGALVAYLWATHTQEVSHVNRSVQPQLQQLAGKSADGTPAGKSATFAAIPSNGAIKRLRVLTIDPAGGLAVYWGLKPNDEIIRIGSFNVGDAAMDDQQSAKDWVVEGMQRKMDMSVNRGGVTITLPADRNASVSPAGTGNGATPSGGSSTVAPGSPARSAEDLVKQLQNQ
jgi:hypothetical protein